MKPLELQQKKESIDFIATVVAAGVDLRRRGNRLVGLCPFHDEKTPSFCVFDDGHYHCFGCGEHGDVIDFVQRLHGLDFKGALNHLGIKQERISAGEKKKIIELARERNRRQKLVDLFREWERAAVHHFSVMVRATYKAMRTLTPGNLDQWGHILQPLSTWEYWLDILTFGDDSEKFALFQEHRKNGAKLLRRKSLFQPDFDYQKWLREKDQINE